jgi:hypothetical protein
MIIVNFTTWWFLHKYQKFKNVILNIFNYSKLGNNKKKLILATVGE